jgi:hypothetical protein
MAIAWNCRRGCCAPHARSETSETSRSTEVHPSELCRAPIRCEQAHAADILNAVRFRRRGVASHPHPVFAAVRRTASRTIAPPHLRTWVYRDAVLCPHQASVPAVEGRVQREGLVIHIVADRLIDLPDKLAGMGWWTNHYVCTMDAATSSIAAVAAPAPGTAVSEARIYMCPTSISTR